MTYPPVIFASALLPEYGPMVCTAAVNHWMQEDPGRRGLLIGQCINKFSRQDYGTTPPEDVAMNLEAIALKDGSRIMGAYEIDSQRIWIITDGFGMQAEGPDYCHTTVLFPEGY